MAPDSSARVDPRDRGRVAWVTGAAGLIGRALLETAPASARGWNVIGLTRAGLDLTDHAALRARFRTDAPALVIHCAGLTQSVACQHDPGLARRLNVELTEVLVETIGTACLFFFSTDLVFDGRNGNYRETDPVNPSSVYAETKARAEAIVLRSPQHAVIRTSLNGGTSPSGNRGFNEQLRHAWEQGQSVRLFTDEFRSPIAAVVTAQAVWRLAHVAASGLLHVAGAERMSRWQIGELLAARWPQLKPRLERASLRDYQGAPRPPDTSLDCAKAQRLLDFPLPGLTEWLTARPGLRF